MSEAENSPTDDLEALLRRAGLDLSADEVSTLRPMYEHYASQAARMHDLDLDDSDLAVAFRPEETLA